MFWLTLIPLKTLFYYNQHMHTSKILSTPSSWIVVLLLASLNGSILNGSSNWGKEAELKGTQPAHFRVTWTADPSQQATISWSTAKQASKGLLRYRVKGSTEKFATLAAETGKYIGGEVELYYYHARMKDLEASTAYEFQIFSDQHKSKPMYFVTAPNDDRPLSIFSGGDSRTDREERRRVNTMLAQMVHDSHANKAPQDDIIALAHGGDYIVKGTNLEQWAEWMSANELTIGPTGRMLPIIPTRGNHDGGKIYNNVFGLDSDNKNYYGVNLSSEVRLVTLNTEISTAGSQKKWLVEELESSRPKNRWLIAQYHRPAYPAVKTPGTALQSWVPTFEKYNVDLVCENDGHTIKRTVPIRGNVKDPSGVVYIGEGGLGVPPRKPKPDRWYLQAPGLASSGSHIFIITCESEKLTCKCVELNGKIADEFSLKPRDLKKEVLKKNTKANKKKEAAPAAHAP